MIDRSKLENAFEFVTLAAARSRQLLKGALPRVEGQHKATVTAQQEVLTGEVVKLTIETPDAKQNPTK